MDRRGAVGEAGSRAWEAVAHGPTPAAVSSARAGESSAGVAVEGVGDGAAAAAAEQGEACRRDVCIGPAGGGRS